ncbi:MAG: HyaD/HybD family hydrogenase maturation endopeptidase [Actinomycetota bacterium]
MRVVVLGVGNILMTDEGVGVRAVEELERLYDLAPEVTVIDGGTSGMDCLDQIAEVDHLLIADAMRSGAEPGTLKRVDHDQLAAHFKTKLSPHQVGLSDVLATLNLHGMMPRRVVLFGMQPKSFATAMELSPEIEARLPALVDALVDELAALGFAPRRKAA